MADIKITLELDNSQYVGALKQVGQQTDNTVNQSKTKVSELINSFKELQTELNNAKTKLEGISGVIAGVGFGAFIKSVMDAGSEAVAAGEKFGITTQRMLEINSAASAVGVSGEKVATMMNKMLVSAEQARDGNLKLRDALNQLGTSTEYLRTHDASEAFMKQVDALAAMEDKGRAAALAQEVLGRGAKTTDWESLSQSLHKYNDSMGAYADAAEKARATSLAIDTYITNLKLTFLQIIEPIEGFIQRILDTKFAINAAIAVIAGLGIITTVIGLFKAWEMAVAAVNIITKAFNATLAVMDALLSPEIAIIMGVVAALAALYVAYEVATGKVGSFSEGFKKLSSDIQGIGSDAWKKVTDLVGLNTKALELNKQAGDKLREGGSPVLAGGDRDMNAKGLADLEKMYDQMTLNNKLAMDRLQIELDNVGATDAVRAAALQKFDTDAKYQKDILAFEEKRKQLLADQKQNRGADHSKEIAEIDQMIAGLQNQKEKTAELKSEIVQGTNARKEAVAFDAQLRTLAEQRLALEQEYNDYTLTADQQKLARLDLELQKQIDAIKKRFEATQGTADQSQWDTKAVEQYNKEVQKTTDRMAELKAQQEKNIAQSRDFGANWNKAMNQYQSDATNGGKIADQAFSSFTSNTEKYFESLATHGKMTFGDLMNAVIEDIIKMEIKAATSSLFSMFTSAAGGSSGGILSGLFGGGHAMGGSIPAGQFGLVGEQGPELVRGPAAVTNANQTADMLGGGHTYITNNITAMDSKSVAQVFAENRQTLFGTVEQARRELPMRTR